MSVEEVRLRPRPPACKIIVAIDGPAGAGKSTVARHLARHFGMLNIESGAMYRAFALKALRAGVPLDASRSLEGLAAETTIRLDPAPRENPDNVDNRVLLDGEDVTGLIRSQAVTDAASRVSVWPAIRTWMVSLQQQLGAGVEWSWRAGILAPWSFPWPKSRYSWMRLRKCVVCAALFKLTRLTQLFRLAANMALRRPASRTR